ncbi:hypothetical protein FRC17_006117, partial [Serendipita sp. 399]
MLLSSFLPFLFLTSVSASTTLSAGSADDSIEFTQNPIQLLRCITYEFSWKGGKAPWSFNAQIRNATHTHYYGGMITWKNSSFTVMTNAPADWLLSFWIGDLENPQHRSDGRGKIIPPPRPVYLLLTKEKKPPLDYAIQESSLCDAWDRSSSVLSSTSDTSFPVTSGGIGFSGSPSTDFPTSSRTSFPISPSTITRTIISSARTSTVTDGAVLTTSIARSVDLILTAPAAMIVIPTGTATSTPLPGHPKSTMTPGIIAAIVISVLLVITIPICAVFFIVHRCKKEGKEIPEPLQRVAALSSKMKVGEKEDATKSKECLVEEGTRLNMESSPSLPSPIPLSAVTTRTTPPTETPFTSQQGLVIPSSKELRMRGGGGGYHHHHGPTGNAVADDTLSVSNISAGETFQTDTVSIWPTMTGIASSAADSNDQPPREERGGRRRPNEPPPPNPDSLFALIGRELEQILQERERDGGQNGNTGTPSTGTGPDETSSSSAFTSLSSPFSDLNAVMQNLNIQIDVSPPPPPPPAISTQEASVVEVQEGEGEEEEAPTIPLA